MTVEVNIPQFLHHLSGDDKVARVEGKTVGECLAELVRLHPKLKESLFDSNGHLAALMNIYINQQASTPDDMDRPVKDGDTIHIAYTMVGG